MLMRVGDVAEPWIEVEKLWVQVQIPLRALELPPPFQSLSQVSSVSRPSDKTKKRSCTVFSECVHVQWRAHNIRKSLSFVKLAKLHSWSVSGFQRPVNRTGPPREDQTPSWCGGGDVAQSVERRTGTLLAQVRFPGAARDTSPRVNFSADSFTASVHHRVQLHALKSVCALKIL